MFGFGLSAADRLLIEKIENTLRTIGTPEALIKGRAKALFDDAKKEAKEIFGDNLYATNLGDRLISGGSEAYQKRVSVGLREDDIRQLWNRPPILNIVEEKMRNAYIVIFLDLEQQRGVPKQQALEKYRKINPIYGDPNAWNPTLPANVGLTEVDALLYPEFSLRIERWREKVGFERIEAMLKNYSSLNALVRDLVSKSEM